VSEAQTAASSRAADRVPAGGREVVSFVHRGGRMTDGQEHAWRQSWSTYGRELPLNEPLSSAPGEPLDLPLAAAAPDNDHLAVEVYQPGLGQLLMRIREQGLTNLRLLRGDAVRVLTAYLEPGTLAGIRVYFPDPWPKRKHHKRRLIQPEFVALAASRLHPGGTLHLATDWAHYAAQMYEVCEGEPTLRNTAADGGWSPRPDWRPLTKFEQRARIEGREVRDLIYRRADPE
jgi:tRNA (guanine-N7-)-methyltransferase